MHTRKDKADTGGSTVELAFEKMDPSGNTTLLITDPVPRAAQLSLGHLLMTPQFLSVEQVGYREPAGNPDAAARLQMMGGEFCGNAARALAALLVEGKHAAATPAVSWRCPPGLTGCTEGAYTIFLEASGSKTPVGALVAPLERGSWWVELTVPTPLSTNKGSCTIDGRTHRFDMVALPGIEHLVVEGVPPALRTYEELGEQRLFTAGVEAHGVMFWNPRENTLTPLVVVGDDAPVWEGSCGSGSIAVAARLALEQRANVADLLLHQPGGDLTVDFTFDNGDSANATIKGVVTRTASGTVCVPRPDA